jgi:hypothetical protein
MMQRSAATSGQMVVARLPRAIILTSGVLLLAGVAACFAWWRTGDRIWIRWFFSYPGALFFVACSLLQVWLSFQCWRRFSPGDLLRPAWLLISLSALSQLTGAIVSQIFGLASAINPLRLLSPGNADALTQQVAEIGQLFGPIDMVFLACGLSYVLIAFRRNGILGRLKPADLLLLSLVVFYTAYFFATVVFASEHGGRTVGVQTILSWTSDPLLCILLFQAILIRRSTANMGLGLISRCWLSFTAAIFMTSIGDIGLWAWSKGFLPYPFVVASWFIWFLPSAAYALGVTYQLIALLRATRGDIKQITAIPEGALS